MRRTIYRLLTATAEMAALAGSLSLFAPAAPAAAASQLVISEVQSGGCAVSVAAATCPSANQDGGAEFIELANLQPSPLIVHGWRVQYVTATGKTTMTLAVLDGTIIAGGGVLIAHIGYGNGADLMFGASGDGGKLAASAGYVQLVDANDVIQDAVGWGSVSAPQLAGWPVTATIPYGGSVGRILPGSPLYGGGQTFAAASWQVSPLGGGYQPALPVDSVTAPIVTAPAAASPVIVTALRWNNGAPVFIQLHNAADTAVDMRGWKLVLTAQNTSGEVSSTLVAFDRWLVPRGYVTAGDGTVAGADITFALPANVLQALATMPSQTLTLLPTSGQPSDLDLAGLAPASFGQWWQRAQSSSGKYTVTGAGSDFGLQSGSATLLGGGLYTPPAGTAGLQIVEILPHAPDCSPLDKRLVCGDYIKLFNAGNSPLDLAAYRLRTNSGGLQSSSGNTFGLQGSLAPGNYLLISTKDDGSPLTLTDSGGYIWLEDSYGVQLYEPIVQYPSASTSDRIGWAWALDGATWVWTATPAPDGPNAIATGGAASGTNPVIALLAPCAAGQYRNPATNRCKLVAAADTTLKVCAPGQTRSPSTNRCRSVLAASTSLQPCVPGESRNPATNRCRKDVAAPAAVQDVAAAKTPANIVPWILTAAAAASALAYGVYEWRQDIQLHVARTRSWLARRLHPRTSRRSRAPH